MVIYLKDSVAVVTRLVASTALVSALTAQPAITVTVDALTGGGGSMYSAPITTDTDDVLTDDTPAYYLTWE